jgi:integrase
MGKLTDVQIRNWVKAGKPIARADGGGLTFTLSVKGTAAWILRYRFGGGVRELTLGRYPDIPLMEARKLATEHRVKIYQGADVAREKQRAKVRAATLETFGKLAKDYMDKVFPALSATTAQQRRRHIERLILPKLGPLPAREVSTADVVSVIAAVGAKSKSTAHQVLTALSEIFKHGIARHVVTGNPCGEITVAAVCGKLEPKRQRLKLTAEELRAVLPELPSIGAPNALSVKILLATCVRLGELAKAEWLDVDFDRGEWLIPDANSKTRQGFTVPLVPAVVDWFRQLEVHACGSRYVLPARQSRRVDNQGGDAPFEQRALNAMLVKLCKRLDGRVRRFSPHDLRSTARSHLAELGVPVVVAERCLNHSLGGLVAVYDQHDYLSERRAALERWTAFLLACEAGQDFNVVPFRRGG